MAIRRDHDNYHWRYENEWPLARTRWTEYYLDAAHGSLALKPPTAASKRSFEADADASSGKLQFLLPALDEELEITGPLKLKLWVSSSSDDADLFVIVPNLRPDGSEVTYPGVRPGGTSKVAAAYGWLRLSQRKLDPVRSTPYRPYLTHDEIQKVVPNEPVSAEIEILPTSTVFARGHRLLLEIGNRDDAMMMFQHDDPSDRIQTGAVTIHTGGRFDTHVLLPVIP